MKYRYVLLLLFIVPLHAMEQQSEISESEVLSIELPDLQETIQDAEKLLRDLDDAAEAYNYEVVVELYKPQINHLLLNIQTLLKQQSLSTNDRVRLKGLARKLLSFFTD